MSNQDKKNISKLKDFLSKEAVKGVFNRNPLLNTPHYVSCNNCKSRYKIIYLDYLKSGEFEFGKTETVEVSNPQGWLTFLELEKITPVIFRFTCSRCGNQIEVKPINLEYLQFIIQQQQTSEIMYS